MIRKIITVLLLLLVPSISYGFISPKYDIYFRKYSRLYFSYAVDWKWFKCQAAAESGINLDPRVVSYAGAVGVMQLMPKTSEWLSKELGIKNNPTDPKTNIMLGIYYDRKLYNIWKKCKNRLERLRFTFASYNAGPGWIIKANKMAPIKIKYTFKAIKKYLPSITGRSNSRQTIEYVERIERYYFLIIGKEVKDTISFVSSAISLASLLISKIKIICSGKSAT